MEWKTAWRYLPINYDTTIGIVEDITQRTYMDNNLNAKYIKIKFSNLYSKEKMILDKVVIGQKKPNSQLIEKLVYITYQGNKQIVVGPGEEFYSDEIVWDIKAQTEIVVSIYIKEKTRIQSACSTWSALSWHTVYGVNGDYTLDQHFEEKESRDIYPFVEADVNKSNIVAGISEIKLYTDKSVKTWFPESERVRLELNEWIRSQRLADGVADFAKQMEQGENPEYMKEGLHIGDGLHPNREGGIVMADLIPMEWILEAEE